MSLREKRSSDVDIDLTSFGDIAFLLIIFFILTTSMVRPFGRVMDMPSGSTPPKSESTPQTPSINILADRIIFTEGEGAERELSLNELRAELYRRELPKQEPNNRMVVLETAEEVTYERYFQVVTTIAEAGGVVAMLSD